MFSREFCGIFNSFFTEQLWATASVTLPISKKLIYFLRALLRATLPEADLELLQHPRWSTL